MTKTKDALYSSAELCRRNGWRRGTKLIGNEGYGDTVIQITAVGDGAILARLISHKGKLDDRQLESRWTLHNRNWKKVTR